MVHVLERLLMSWPILSVTVFLPLVGALFIMTLRGDDAAVERNARWVALWTTLITFAISLVLIWRFDASSAEFQFVERRPWLGGAITYHMGVDGISLPFVILTTGLLPICIIASFEAVQRRVKEYMIAFLVLETLMVGTFSALDLVLFYLFFEGGLIPMFLIIGIWGGPRRVYASFKFFLYTLLGSVLMLLAIGARAPRISRRCCTTSSRARCRPGPGLHFWLRSPSSFQCGRCTRGSPTRMSKRRRPGRLSWRRSCSRWVATVSCGSRSRCSRWLRRNSLPSCSRWRWWRSSTRRWSPWCSKT
jgi:hypothetical protein